MGFLFKNNNTNAMTGTEQLQQVSYDQLLRKIDSLPRITTDKEFDFGDGKIHWGHQFVDGPMKNALRAILEFHKNDEGHCVACEEVTEDSALAVLYPCPTVKIIESYIWWNQQ